MSKRKVTHQQKARIQKIQDRYQAPSDSSLPAEEGLVLSRFGHHAEVETTQKTIVHCAIRPNLESIVAGDKIIWEKTSERQGVIVSCFPRHAVLGRYDSRGAFKAVAANMTQLMIVTAVTPETMWLLVDSYLVLAEHFNLKTALILNKTDLASDELKNTLITQYQSLGYPIIMTSSVTSTGLKELISYLQDETSVFIGQSGVGKSSLIGQLLPDTAISTADPNMPHLHGRHTTSNSRLYHFPFGGQLIDSPGVRGFNISHLSKEAIVYGFREFRLLAAQCQFRNCNHVNSLGCAIVQAVGAESPLETRYHNLIKLLSDATQ